MMLFLNLRSITRSTIIIKVIHSIIRQYFAIYKYITSSTDIQLKIQITL